MNLQQLENFKTFLGALNSDIDLANYANQNIENFNDLADEIDFNLELIYYSNAIQYLKEHDPSLMESIALAVDLGYNLSNVNSELLASLLYSENERNKFYLLEDEINEYLTNIENENN